MSERLDEFPEALRGPPGKMPWELPLEPTRWQWGLDAGKPLRDIESRELLRKRQWLERKNGSGDYFAGLIAEIDLVLTERQGE